MQTFIVSDIFGRTKALENLALAVDVNAIIIDPYDKVDMNFYNEQSAYEGFNTLVGLDAYTQHLCDAIKAHNKPALVIGFSVGASTIWNASELNDSLINDPETLALSNVTRAICYYPGQIRHKPHIKPGFPTELVFPAFEKHFCVDDLREQLINTANVSIRKTSYLHGFMNQLSVNFNKQGYDFEIDGLRKTILPNGLRPTNQL